MSKSRTARTRRHRRQRKAALKHRNAKPRHRLRSGRTGSVHYKKRRSARG